MLDVCASVQCQAPQRSVLDESACRGFGLAAVQAYGNNCQPDSYAPFSIHLLIYGVIIGSSSCLLTHFLP